MPRYFARWLRRLGALASILLVLTIGQSGHAQSDPETTERLSTTRLIQLAIEDNPELAALHDQWSAALLRARGARSTLPQPQLSYRAYVLAVETRQGPQRHLVTLSQAFPWFRTLRDQADPHLADAARIAAEFDSHVLDVVYRLEAAVIELGRLDALANAIRGQRQLYQDVVDHQSAVMPFGGAEHADLLRTTLMVAVLTDRILDLERRADHQLVAIRREVRAPELGREDIAVGTVEDPGADWDLETLMEAAGAGNPAFTVLDARRTASLERAEAASNGVLPMPAVSISWGVVNRYETPLPNTGRGGSDVFSVGVSMPLPVFRRQFESAVGAFEADADAMLDAEQSLRWNLRSELDDSLIRIAEERERIERYERDLLPTAHDIAEHYALTVAQGGANHTEYLLAYEQELQMEVAVINARYAIAHEIARIQRATAAGLEELQPTASVGAEEAP